MPIDPRVKELLRDLKSLRERILELEDWARRNLITLPGLEEIAAASPEMRRMAGQAGLEPATARLTAACSAVELPAKEGKGALERWQDLVDAGYLCRNYHGAADGHGNCLICRQLSLLLKQFRPRIPR